MRSCIQPLYRIPVGKFHIRRSGGLDLTSSLEAKFGARFSQFHRIRGKNWEVLLPQDAKVGKESQVWGHLRLYLKFKGQNLGYLSPIFLQAKFGAPTRISEAKFGAKSPPPPDLLYGSTPWVQNKVLLLHFRLTSKVHTIQFKM